LLLLLLLAPLTFLTGFSARQLKARDDGPRAEPGFPFKRRLARARPCVLYLPIVILVTYSFTPRGWSRYGAAWSLRWYWEFFSTAPFWLEAAVMSFRRGDHIGTIADGVLGTWR